MDKRFTNSDRFVFCRNKYTGNMQITDLLEHFEPVELSDELAKVLSQIVWEHTQLVNEKKKGLFDLNNLRDFVKKNNDLDKEILIALINKGVEKKMTTRFIVDDTGTLIDIETRNTYDYVSEVLPLLNDLTNEIKIARTVLDMNRGMIKEIQNENYQLKKLFLEMLRQTDVEINPKKPTKYSATLIFDMEQYLTVRDIVKRIK